MEYTPFKCPDCKVWWRGETHKCETPKVKVEVDKTLPWIKDNPYTTGGKPFTIKPRKIDQPQPTRRFCVICDTELWPSDLEGWRSGYCWKHKGEMHKWSKKEY